MKASHFYISPQKLRIAAFFLRQQLRVYFSRDLAIEMAKSCNNRATERPRCRNEKGSQTKVARSRGAIEAALLFYFGRPGRRSEKV